MQLAMIVAADFIAYTAVMTRTASIAAAAATAAVVVYNQ
jgi:hypothetical protein